MHLKDILRRKGSDVHSIGPDASVREAIAAMNRHRIGAMVVTDSTGEVVGILTERDVLRMYGDDASSAGVAGRTGDPREARVGDLMTSELIIALPEDTIAYAMGIMTQNRIRHLPILDDGSLCGIVSIGDVVREHLSEAQYENRLLRSYIQGTAPD